MPPSVKGLL